MIALPTEALILAGGFGTRLKPVVSDVPKPMATVAGKPFLAHLLEYWYHQGIRRAVLSVGYKAESIREYFGSRYYGLDISYVQEHEPLGTGGAVKYALEKGNWREQSLLLLNGDTWFEADGSQLARDFANHGVTITMALAAIENTGRYGGVTVNKQGVVTDFTSGKPGKTFINAGCYLLDRHKLAIAMQGLPQRFSFEDTLLSALATKSELSASIQDCTFLDIGIPEDYRRAEIVMKTREKRYGENNA